MKQYKSLILALVSGLTFLPLLSAAQELSILYHENLEIGLEMSPSGIDAKPTSTSGSLGISFTAFGRQFDLALRPNDRLIQNLSAELRQSIETTHLYSGEVRDTPGSWVRLAIANGLVTGAIWDGFELYLIDRRSDIADLLVSTGSSEESETVIYRWSDTVGPLSDAFIAPKNDAPMPFSAIDQASENLVEALLSPMQQLDIGVVGDSSLPTGRSNAAYLIGILNVADGIFLSQLGVYLNVVEVVIYDSIDDPISSNDGATVLSQTENVKATTPALQNLGLVHLFTGRDLVDGADGDTELAGIANLGVLCDQSLGVGVSEARFGVPSALIAAHEIGHNFGAPHDNEIGSACEDTPEGFLMNPTISGDAFSQCSIDQIEPYLAAATCLVDIPPGDLQLRSVDSLTMVPEGDKFDIVFAVDNLSAGDALFPELTISASNFTLQNIKYIIPPEDRPPWDCDTSSVPFRCWRNTLLVGESDEFEVSLRADSPVGGSVTVEVTSQNDNVPENNQLIRDIAIAPDVDLSSGIGLLEEIGYRLRPYDEVTIRAVTGNTGDDSATDVEMEFTLPDFLEVLNVAPSTGSCNIIDSPLHQSCSVGSLAYNEEAFVDIAVRALQLNHQDVVWREGLLKVQSSSAETDDSPGNNLDEQIIFISDRYVTLLSILSIPDEVEAGTETMFDLSVSNTGPDEATDIRIEFTFRDYELSGLLSPTGPASCDYEPQESRLTCEAGNLLPDEEIAFSWRGVVGTQSSLEGYFGINMKVIPREFNLNGNIQEFDYIVQVTPSANPPEPQPEPEPSPQPQPQPQPSTQPAGGGGGGGGAADPVWLLLLLGAMFRPRQRGVARARDALCCESVMRE